MDQLCQQAILQDRELVPAAWLAAFAALIGTTLAPELNALLQHPLIPSQFRWNVNKVKNYVTKVLSCTGPSWHINQTLPDVRDALLGSDNVAASRTDANPRWRNWDEDYAMGYQLHP